MSRPRILHVAVAACLLPAFSIPLRAQDFAADVVQHRPAAEAGAAISPTNNDPNPPQWGQDRRPVPGKRYWKGVWIATWVAFVAVNVLDAHSSAGRYEGNPLLRDDSGVFSGRRALVVKSAAGGGFFALQCWLAHRDPGENHYKAFAVATGAATAALGFVAVRNYGVGKAERQAVMAPAYLLRQP
jgi:hypothetical protein